MESTMDSIFISIYKIILDTNGMKNNFILNEVYS